jgi:uncharacterized repeat protein (TIGR01451 family)
MFVRVLSVLAQRPRVLKAFAAGLVILASLIASSAARADTLDWNTRPATNLRTGGTDALTYGTAPAQITVTTSGSATGTFDFGGPNTLAIEPGSTSNGTTGYINSTMNASVDNESAYHTTTISFTEPVYNVSVIAGDIDGGPTFTMSGAAFNDIVEFRAVNVAGSTILPTSGTPASGLVTWNAGTGRASSTNVNITDGSGNVTVTFAGPIRSFTVRHIAGANSTVSNPTQQFTYIETVTYTRSPLLTVQKTSLNGTGTFTFDRSNSLNTGTTPWNSTTTSTSVTTVTAGVAVTGAPGILFATSTATTFTETAPSGWVITSSPVTCTDSNSGVSGNPASFNATVSGLVVTVAAANIRAGASITCAITNDVAAPALAMTKTPDVASINAAGQTVTYSILVSNTGNTTLGPITVSDALGSVTCPSSGGTTVTSLAAGANETCSFSYVVPQAVLDSNGGGDGDIDNTASSSTTYNGSPVNSSANAAVALVITPGLLIDKSASTAGPVNANDNYSYTFRVRNTGNVTLTSISVNDIFSGYGVPPVPGSETMFADAAPLGDSTDSIANGSWDVLAPGDEIEFTAAYTVVQGDIDNP